MLKGAKEGVFCARFSSDKFSWQKSELPSKFRTELVDLYYFRSEACRCFVFVNLVVWLVSHCHCHEGDFKLCEVYRESRKILHI